MSDPGVCRAHDILWMVIINVSNLAMSIFRISAVCALRMSVYLRRRWNWVTWNTWSVISLVHPIPNHPPPPLFPRRDHETRVSNCSLSLLLTYEDGTDKEFQDVVSKPKSNTVKKPQNQKNIILLLLWATSCYVQMEASFSLLIKIWGVRGSAVGWVTALQAAEGRGFGSRWRHWNFSVISSFRSHCGPGVDPASNRNV